MYSKAKMQTIQVQECLLKDILKQALTGLMCMHQHNMVHLDIKPENLLMKDKDLKLADLGLCRITRIKKWSDLDEGDSRYLAK
jgi:serine/threonine protein kinase